MRHDGGVEPVVTIADVTQWQRVREMRIKALASDPLAYGATAETESGYDEDHWRQVITDDRWILISVADRDVAIAGVCAHMPELVQERCADPRGAWVYGCWVDPQWRGRGLAGVLFDEGERCAVEWELPKVGLGVFTTNIAARRAYERMGLVALGEPLRSTRRPSEHYQPMMRAVTTSAATSPRLAASIDPKEHS